MLISGKVQGVSFRFYTQEQANRLKLRGFVRNLDDGRVEIVAAGEREDLENLLEWAKKGPPAARVKDVIVTDVKDEIPGGAFQIQRDGGKF
jgi:acylphosphatase